MLCPAGRVLAQPVLRLPAPPVLAAAAGPAVVWLEEPVQAGTGKVQIQWSINHPEKGGYYTIERAGVAEGPYEVLGVIRSQEKSGRFIDELPMRGKNHYRVKWTMESGVQRVSRPVISIFAGDMTCRFYPNPVDNVLIVRSEQTLDLLITDGTGRQRLNVPLQAGLQTVDVSQLEKGLYIITLSQKESGRILTEKLVKN